MKTGLIRYNVRDRGRRHRGTPRNFDSVALAAVINGPEVQERVKNRDLSGYYGHLLRQRFGMEPGEGAIVDGKFVMFEPAIVTTTLRAEPDGTIEHESEFLDSAPGRSAKRLFSSRKGGFSSAISMRPGAGYGFHGFDFVAEPNYTGNRGFALDGVREPGHEAEDTAGDAGESADVLDSAIVDEQRTLTILDGLYTDLQARYDEVVQRCAWQGMEMDALLAVLARRAPAQHEAAAQTLAHLDGVFERPLRLADGGVSIGAVVSAFAANRDLPTLQGAAPASTAEADRLAALIDHLPTLLRR